MPELAAGAAFFFSLIEALVPRGLAKQKPWVGEVKCGFRQFISADGVFDTQRIGLCLFCCLSVRKSGLRMGHEDIRMSHLSVLDRLLGMTDGFGPMILRHCRWRG